MKHFICLLMILFCGMTILSQEQRNFSFYADSDESHIYRMNSYNNRNFVGEIYSYTHLNSDISVVVFETIGTEKKYYALSSSDEEMDFNKKYQLSVSESPINIKLPKWDKFSKVISVSLSPLIFLDTETLQLEFRAEPEFIYSDWTVVPTPGLISKETEGITFSCHGLNIGGYNNFYDADNTIMFSDDTDPIFKDGNIFFPIKDFETRTLSLYIPNGGVIVTEDYRRIFLNNVDDDEDVYLEWEIDLSVGVETLLNENLDQTIYIIDGRKIYQQDTNNLPVGIYIIGKNKRMVKK